MLGESLDAELLGVTGGGCRRLGRFPAVRGRLPPVVRRDVVAVDVVVAVHRVLGRATVRAGYIPLINPMLGETLLALMAAGMRSGEDVPVPALLVKTNHPPWECKWVRRSPWVWTAYADFLGLLVRAALPFFFLFLGALRSLDSLSLGSSFLVMCTVTFPSLGVNLLQSLYRSSDAGWRSSIK